MLIRKVIQTSVLKNSNAQCFCDQIRPYMRGYRQAGNEQTTIGNNAQEQKSVNPAQESWAYDFR